MSRALSAEVRRAIKRLRKMGLRVHVEYDRDLKDLREYALIFIDINSLCDLVARKIDYPLKRVYIEENWMVVKVWK